MEVMAIPWATKDAPARPFDIEEAIERAAECRARRERCGLNVEGLARLAGVSERSVNRWESWEGRGSCPDDVLDLLDSLLDRQADIVSAAVAAVAADCGGLGGHATAPDVSESGLRTAAPGGAACMRQGGGGELNQAVYPGLAPGGDRGRKTDLPKSTSMPGGGGGGEDDLDAGFVRLDADSMPWVTLLYYPSQRCYELCHPNDSTFYGVANANARAIAQELERLGFGIEWRYATPELLEGFTFDYV